MCVMEPLLVTFDTNELDQGRIDLVWASVTQAIDGSCATP